MAVRSSLLKKYLAFIFSLLFFVFGNKTFTNKMFILFFFSFLECAIEPQPLLKKNNLLASIWGLVASVSLLLPLCVDCLLCAGHCSWCCSKQAHSPCPPGADSLVACLKLFSKQPNGYAPVMLFHMVVCMGNNIYW